ncbi:MAG TPA: hypothetical protein VIM71_13630 [Lacunisphaera sp.]
MLGAVLLTAAARGADAGAPLESTKQELRKLNDGQKPGTGPGAAEGLRPSLPTIQTPGQESLPLPELMDPEKLEKERKRQKNERKNWLVNGVGELERKDKAKTAEAFSTDETKEEGSDSRLSDKTDPQYLLKLYDEQKKVEEARKLDTRTQRPPQADPLAPFLQGWLGNSPVRGQFFDEFARKPEGASAGAAPAVPPGVGPTRDFGTPVSAATPAKDPAAKPNPYLAELNRPVPNEAAVGVLSGQTPVSPALTTPSLGRPLIPSTPSPAEVRPPERKPLPTPLADDKKYFPQLKKF